MLLPLFKQLSRPHMELCIQVLIHFLNKLFVYNHHWALVTVSMTLSLNVEIPSVWMGMVSPECLTVEHTWVWYWRLSCYLHVTVKQQEAKMCDINASSEYTLVLYIIGNIQEFTLHQLIILFVKPQSPLIN